MVIKVVVTVSVYGLLLYDARVRKGTWEELDDAVYFVKAAGNTVEFLCAVLLFLNGGWILASYHVIKQLKFLTTLTKLINQLNQANQFLDLYD